MDLPTRGRFSGHGLDAGYDPTAWAARPLRRAHPRFSARRGSTGTQSSFIPPLPKNVQGRTAIPPSTPVPLPRRTSTVSARTAKVIFRVPLQNDARRELRAPFPLHARRSHTPVATPCGAEGGRDARQVHVGGGGGGAYMRGFRFHTPSRRSTTPPTSASRRGEYSPNGRCSAPLSPSIDVGRRASGQEPPRGFNPLLQMSMVGLAVANNGVPSCARTCGSNVVDPEPAACATTSGRKVRRVGHAPFPRGAPYGGHHMSHVGKEATWTAAARSASEVAGRPVTAEKNQGGIWQPDVFHTPSRRSNQTEDSPSPVNELSARTAPECEGAAPIRQSRVMEALIHLAMRELPPPRPSHRPALPDPLPGSARAGWADCTTAPRTSSLGQQRFRG